MPLAMDAPNPNRGLAPMSMETPGRFKKLKRAFKERLCLQPPLSGLPLTVSFSLTQFVFVLRRNVLAGAKKEKEKKKSLPSKQLKV